MLNYKKEIEELIKKGGLNTIIIVNINKRNVYSVFYLNEVAVGKKRNLNKYKLILLKSEGKILAIARIVNLIQYDKQKYAKIWGLDNRWRSIIKFDDVMYLGDKINNMFGENSGLKSIETVGYFHDKNEIEKLKNLVDWRYILNIKNYLESLGLME